MQRHATRTPFELTPSPALRRELRSLTQAVLAALASLALVACGGGGGADDALSQPAQAGAGSAQTAPTEDTAAAWASELTTDRPDTTAPAGFMSLAAASNVTMTKVGFANSDGQALTGFLFQDSGATPRNAAVVLMHGCAGVWSNGVISTDPQPAMNTLAHLNRRWGANLARAGYKVLLVDSFTSRGLTNECNNGTAGLNEAVVRPRDALAGRAWLLANGHAVADRVALIGWSNGASAVLATMERRNEGSAGARPFQEGFAFYPGCGLINEFGGDASTPAKTTWVPYAPVTIHHGSTDGLYTDGRCANRIATAQMLGASAATGNAVQMTVYSGARHSFDLIDITKSLSSPYTSADVDAQVAADAAVMQRLDARFGGQ